MANISKAKTKPFDQSQYLKGANSAATDVTQAPQATSQSDVNNQDSRTRLWQSLSNTYGNTANKLKQQYAANKSAADRAAFQRGMGRSSYNLQNMANIDNELAKALQENDNALIADYQNRITDLENQEWTQDFQQQQFDYQQKSDEQKIAYNYVTAILANGGNPSDDLLAQAGLSREDANALKVKATRSGGHSSNPGTTNPPPTTPPTQQTISDIFNYNAPQANPLNGNINTYDPKKPHYVI